MTDYILIALIVAILLMAGLSIPLLVQILRTAREMSLTLGLLNERLPLIMKNLEEITTNVNRTTVAVQHQVEEISVTLRRIQGVVGVVVGLEELIRQRMSLPVGRMLRTSMAVGKGVRVFVDQLAGGSRGGGGGRSA